MTDPVRPSHPVRLPPPEPDVPRGGEPPRDVGEERRECQRAVVAHDLERVPTHSYELAVTDTHGRRVMASPCVCMEEEEEAPISRNEILLHFHCI